MCISPHKNNTDRLKNDDIKKKLRCKRKITRQKRERERKERERNGKKKDETLPLLPRALVGERCQ